MEHAHLCLDQTFGVFVLLVWLLLAGAMFTYAWYRTDLWRAPALLSSERQGTNGLLLSRMLFVYLLLSLVSLFLVALLGGQTSDHRARGAECFNGVSVALAALFFFAVLGVGLYALARSQAALVSDGARPRSVAVQPPISLKEAERPAAAGSERLLRGGEAASGGL
jgi:hypothetical protein